MRGRLFAVVLVLSALAVLARPASGAPPIDQLSDLTGRAGAIATLKARDNFANQFEYDVIVRNLTGEPLPADALVIVVDAITDLAGKDATDRIDVIGFDGRTKDGKPYFRVPSQGMELPPYGESQPATVRLRNPYYTILFTPSFKVRGQTQPTPKAEQGSVDSLVDVLTKKGVITKEEGAGIRKRQPTAP
jgi:hypothetical protein